MFMWNMWVETCCRNHPQDCRPIVAPIKDSISSFLMQPETLSFNPRTSSRCDFPVHNVSEPKECFNPRIRKGCDPARKSEPKRFNSFNPRIRKGCDVSRAVLLSTKETFQSTHLYKVRLLINSRNQ